MQVAYATTSDISQLTSLINSAYRGDTSRAGWTTEADLLDGLRIDEKGLLELLENPDATLLKLEDHTIAGCVYLKKNGDTLYLGMLTVSPFLQGKGYGKILLKEAERIALSKKCRSIFMTVISQRKELIAWYERHGYTQTGETKPFPADVRFGTPKMPLEFVVLEKHLY